MRPNAASARISNKDYRRRHPPHLDGERAYQFVTFRLADSLPVDKRQALEQELLHQPPARRDRERHKRIERWLDAGLGSCALRHPTMAVTMQQSLKYFDGQCYQLIDWCIMPNHVHVLLQTLTPLPQIIRSWKLFTARWAKRNAPGLGIRVPADTADANGNNVFWMRDYWDRYIRDEKHYRTVQHYIRHNPVKAGLCEQPRDWPWSSAYSGDAG